MCLFMLPFTLDTYSEVEDEELEIRAPVTRVPRRNRDEAEHFKKWDELEFCRFRTRKILLV